TIKNCKAIRETLNADIRLAIDHFRYFATAVCTEEGTISDLDEHTVSIQLPEALGVVGQIIPWTVLQLMATWIIAPAVAAVNSTIVKPAEQTPASIMVLLELVGEAIPDGVLNVVNAFGPEAGQPLASSERISKVAFTGETT